MAFGALRHRNFRLFFTGHLISLVGWWMHQLALPWLVLDLTGSAFFVGLTSALGALPVTALVLVGGAVADRFPRRRVILTTQSVAMVVALGLAATVLNGTVTMMHVVAAAACFGLVAAFDIPGRQSFFIELVGRRDLMSAIVLNSSAFNASRILGPAVGGLIIATVGVGLCFLLNGLSYVAVLTALLLIRLSGPAPATGGPATSRSILAGLRFAVDDPRVRTLVLVIAVAGVTAFPYQILVPVVARETLGLGAREYGWLMSAAGIGALAGGLTLAARGPALRPERIVSVAPVLFGLAVAGFGLAPSFLTAFGALVLVGLLMISHTASTNTLIQTVVPDALRGRVLSVYTFAFIGLAPVGSLVAGTVAEQFGAVTMLVGGGLACSVVSAVAMWRTPSLRQINTAADGGDDATPPVS